MAGFFIDRPVFAVVIALFICLGGLLALPFLPIAQYPIIAPPSSQSALAIPAPRRKTSTPALRA
jgi:multidrug efflux pump